MASYERGLLVFVCLRLGKSLRLVGNEGVGFDFTLCRDRFKKVGVLV